MHVRVVEMGIHRTLCTRFVQDFIDNTQTHKCVT